MNDLSNPPVLIVGAGPVGQLAALLLSKHEIPSLLLDRHQATQSAPKAHALNPRTLEICESAGVSANRLRKLGANINDGGDVRFVGTLTGPEFGSLPYERQDEAALEHTPFPLCNLSQPLFETELNKAIAADPNITFRRGVECTSLTQNSQRVVADLLERKPNQTRTHEFQYAIAADGAGSGIRSSLGIEMQGPEAIQDFLMLHYTVDLRRFTRNRRGVLYFLFDPTVQGTLIAYDQGSTWVLMHPWDSQTEVLADYGEDRCLELLSQAVGEQVTEATIENISPWSMSAQVAEHYCSSRIFLAGDAAHRFPPAGGLGLNTGAGDAQNLAWKLAAVLKGQAGIELLPTYDTERRQVACVNSEQSLTNAAKIFELFAAIHGSDPGEVAVRYAQVKKDPSAFQEISAAVEEQKPHFDSFNLQLGYRYTSRAIHKPAPIPELGDIADYRPSWESGAHFPHRWVAVDGQVKALQTLLSATSFTLLRGPDAPEFEVVEHATDIRWGTDFSDKSSWSLQTGLSDAGALLIRPDGHIAARFEQPTAHAIDTVMNSLLFRENQV